MVLLSHNYKFTLVWQKKLENSFDCRCGIYCSNKGNKACYFAELVMLEVTKVIEVGSLLDDHYKAFVPKGKS